MLPGATAKSVGLTAATTVPCAETSRTKGPSVTVAMRRRSRAIVIFGRAPAADEEAEDESTTTSAPATRPIIFWRVRSGFAATEMSCDSVPRIETSPAGVVSRPPDERGRRFVIFMTVDSLVLDVARGVPSLRRA